MEWLKKYGLYIGIGVFIWLIGFALLLNSNNKNSNNESIIAVNDDEKKVEIINEEKTTNEKQLIKVDVKGYVKKPGVYELEANSIVNDVINLAGGLKNGGTTKNINLSKRLKDEMVIYIYNTSDLKKYEKQDNECKCNDVIISSCEGSSIIYPDNNDSSEKPLDSLININKASISELMNLSGIGEAKAKAIIEYREKNGLFKNIEDIKNVSGIGEAAYQKIKDYITI